MATGASKNFCFLGTGDVSYSGALFVGTDTNGSTGTIDLSTEQFTALSFTGTTATWTLPPITGSKGRILFIKNRGTGNLTIHGNGGDAMWDSSSVASIIILPGASRIMVCDDSIWNVE